MAGSAVLAALYLPCGQWSAPYARRWPKVLQALDAADSGGPGSAEARLRRAGLWEEAACLAHPARLSWGAEQVLQQRALTICDQAYPSAWLDSLHDSAPPALWRRGPIPVGRAVAAVGSRRLSARAREFAGHLGQQLAHSGFALVSGAARGADLLTSAAYEEAGGQSLLQILPCGLAAGAAFSPHAPGSWLSPFDPQSPFSGAQAMLRNRLIYAWSRRAVVVEARLQAGGTWGGAIDALRRRLGQLIVADWGDPASRALAALGAQPLAMQGGESEGWAHHLSLLLQQPLPQAQPDLFGLGSVRETRATYARS